MRKPKFEGSGVFPIQWLRAAVDSGIIGASDPIPDTSYQPASLDLRLGDRAHRLRCSFLPGARSVEESLKELAMGEVDIRGEGGVLDRNRPYLIPLKERLELPRRVRGRANPKSSTGRVDVLTRVISDGGHSFDEIRAGYEGGLWLEVIPLSFTVRLREDLSLNQLRLFVGESVCRPSELRETHRRTPLLLQHGQLPLDLARVRGDGIFLTLDLRGDAHGIVGLKAKRNSQLVDLGRSDHDPEEFWEPVRRESRGLVLDPDDFYLLLSAERVRIPPELAAEMTAYDPTAGELRTHYAGFFDPGFGHRQHAGRQGAHAALEVRAHDVPFLIEEGQYVCKLVFERMAEVPDVLYGSGVGSSYQYQETMLGKHFRGQDGQQVRLLNVRTGPARRGRPVAEDRADADHDAAAQASLPYEPGASEDDGPS